MELEFTEISLFGKPVNTVFFTDGDGWPCARIGQMNLTGEALTSVQLRDIAALLELYANEIDRLEGLSNE